MKTMLSKVLPEEQVTPGAFTSISSSQQILLDAVLGNGIKLEICEKGECSDLHENKTAETKTVITNYKHNLLTKVIKNIMYKYTYSTNIIL